MFFGIAIITYCCQPTDPSTHSTRKMDLNFILQGNSPCNISYGANTVITILISSMEGDFKNETQYSGLQSPNGSLEVDVPLNGDFTIYVDIKIGCNDCCTECFEYNVNGEPSFVGFQEQSNTQDLGINVRLRFNGCVCCLTY